VQDRIDAAFRLLANAVTELNRTPIRPDVDNWFNTLFGRPVPSARENYVLQRMTLLAAISQHNQNDQTTPGGIIDVRFYCTTDRITRRNNGIIINKDRNLAYNKEDTKSRFLNCYDLKPPTLMITMRFTNEFNEIQICPWFLRKARGFKFVDLMDTSQPFYSLVSRVAIPLAARTMYTPIDAFLLMDKVIVHELTHTQQSIPATVDQQPNPYGKQAPLLPHSCTTLCPVTRQLTFRLMHSGLKNALEKVQTWRANPNAQNDPQANADSNALFATGTWIMLAPGGSPIGPDGSFTTPNELPKVRA
jgi:hypothetical protein